MTRSLAGVTVVGVCAAAVGACPVEILVPAYQYPTVGDLWSRVPAAAGQVGVSVILNPASGPGTVVDPTYTAVVSTARAAGARIYGYVDTDYARRPAAAVLADVQTFTQLYAIDGVFLDQMDNQAASLAYYQGLRTGIHAIVPGSLANKVIANPGTEVPEAFAAGLAADVFVTYENNAMSAVAPYAAYTPPAWVFAYPRERFCHIVYNVGGQVAMDAAVGQALSQNVGMVFFTDGLLPNPYDHLPAYWDAEVAAVRARACVADFNCSGAVSVQDVFDFLGAYFAGEPAADVNGAGGVSVQDVFDFLAAFFEGCS